MKIPAEDILKVLLQELKTIAKTETVLGREYQAGETTIIPVSKVTLGLVGGSGSGGTRKGGEKFSGGGVGGGASKIEPIAFLVLKGDEISLLNIGKGRYVEAVLDVVPEFLENLAEKYIKERRDSASKTDTDKKTEE